MNVWFCILVIMQILNLGISMGKHGERVTKEYNAFVQLVASVLGITLLYLAVKTGF